MYTFHLPFTSPKLEKSMIIDKRSTGNNSRRRPLRPRPLPPPLQSPNPHNPPRPRFHNRRPSPSSALRALRNPRPLRRWRTPRYTPRRLHTHEHDMAQTLRRGHNNITKGFSAMESRGYDCVAFKHVRESVT